MHYKVRIMDRVYNPIQPLTHTVSVLTGQFLTPARARVISETTNPFHDPSAVSSGWNPLDLFGS